MGNECNKWGCTDKPAVDLNGNELRGGFCSQHGYYNAKYDVWASSPDVSDHDLQIKANEKKTKETQKKTAYETQPMRKAVSNYTKCLISTCSRPASQCGLCDEDFQTQMMCKRQGISGMFKQY